MRLGEIASRAMAGDLVGRTRAAIPDEQAWLVGGAVRDVALGREVKDIDLAVSGSPEEAARAVAAGLGGTAFGLSAEFATWRARDRAGEWQVDLTALRGPGIEDDLSRRDFTVGAIAVDLATGEGIDPTGGLDDLASGIVRAVGPESFTDDPLRLMRVARLVAQFNWTVEAETAELARAVAGRAAEPAGERILAEFCLLVAAPHPVAGVEMLDSLGILEAVLPEMAALHDVVQGPNHHLDVYGHTLEVLEGVMLIESDLDRFSGPRSPEVREMLNEPLADGVTRSTGLRLAALLHDCAKPQTRTERDGIISFRGHDRDGADQVRAIFGRLKASNRLAGYVAEITRHHLVLGFMVPEHPLNRHQIYAYLRHTDPVTVDVTLLTVADRLAARGSASIASREMVESHLELAKEMVGYGLDWRRDGPPEPFLRGDRLAAELGIEPGPELGRVVEALAEARYTGEIHSASEAVDFGRRFLDAS